jgi:glutaredoxin 3
MMGIMTHVIIYTTLTCPYCTSAKKLLRNKGVDYVEINVKDQDKLEEMRAKSNGRRTVPQIFINGYHVGGFDDLNRLNKDGKLDKLLEEEKHIEER